MKKKLPLFADRPRDAAVLNPKEFINLRFHLKGTKKFTLPPICLICFHPSFYALLKEITKPIVHTIRDHHHPIYVFKFKGVAMSLVYSGIGSFSTTVLEEMIALGAKTIIFFGGVGILDPNIPRGELLIPTKALRDEGVSFHYESPSRYSFPSQELVNAIQSSLRKKNVMVKAGPCWTTDAPYRETFVKIKEFYGEGILAVDMEAASFFSIARFRKVKIAGVFSAGDFVGGKKWDPRRTRKAAPQFEMARERFFRLVLDVAAEL